MNNTSTSVLTNLPGNQTAADIKTDEDVRAAILEARKQYEQGGTQWSARAETEIDEAEIFAVDELNPHTGSITQSFDFESLSASVGAPIDLSN